MGLIDLNSCTARQLTEYSRIGKSLADSIIRYRRCYGGYKHFDELWKITGISRASYRNLQQYFYVGGLFCFGIFSVLRDRSTTVILGKGELLPPKL